MKRFHLRLIVSIILMMIVSCDEPETVVINIVHADGSVTRKIEMRNSKNIFEKSDLQVPFDNTWSVTDSMEVRGKGDTIWIKRAEKQIKSVEEINLSYKSDSSVNGKMKRHADFNKKFRWFNTEYRFSETIDKQILSGYPVCDFLNEEELTYFYSPDYIKFDKENGTDSVKYRMLADSIDKKSEEWITKNVASIWIKEFSRLIGSKSGPELSAESLNSREDEFIAVINENIEEFDSLWSTGVLLKKFIGEADGVKFKTEADSALTIGLEKFLVGSSSYSMKIVMPGKLIAANGYMDSTKNLLWAVKSDYFITDQYEMWAMSKTPNIWTWFVSGLFLVFVSTGIFIKRKSRREAGLKP